MHFKLFCSLLCLHLLCHLLTLFLLCACSPAAPASLCRQCPGAMATTFPTSSSSVTPPPYTCPPYGSHIVCQCCMEPMPIRGSDESGVPPQHCEDRRTQTDTPWHASHIRTSLACCDRPNKRPGGGLREGRPFPSAHLALIGTV